MKNAFLFLDDEVFNYQNIEKELFADDFSVKQAKFPRKIFKVDFDRYFLIETQDWFSSEPDFRRLANFLKNIDSDFFYASAPPFYMVNAVKISVESSFQNYTDFHTYTAIKHKLTGIGVRKSPETFFYDETKNWAIICDITTNITLVGLKNKVLEGFETAFDGHYKDVKNFLENHFFGEDLLEEFKKNYGII